MSICRIMRGRGSGLAALSAASVVATLFAAGAANAKSMAPGQAPPVAETFGRYSSQDAPSTKPAYVLPSSRFGLDQAAAPMIRFGSVDTERLLAEDALQAEAGNRRLRISTAQFGTVLLEDGVWRDVPGGRLWMVDLSAEGAYGLRAMFTGVDLPTGAELVSYAVNDVRTDIDGPTPADGRRGEGVYWTGTHAGDTMRVEYFVPDDATGGNADVPFAINEIQHIYRDIFRDGEGRGAGACHNDPACFAAWTDQSEAMTRLFYISGGDGYVCTGQLIDTLSGDETPYLLTANHCLNTQSEASTVEALFRYRRLTCGGAINFGIAVDGAEYIDSNFGADHCLLMLEGALPSTAFFAGWTTSIPGSGTDCTMLHHPAGDYGRISFGDKLNNPNCGGPSTRFVAVSWFDGVSEPGSSGSGFYRDSTQQLFGVLTCGASSCSNPNGIDSFGRFDYAYNTAGFDAYLDEGTDDSFEPNDSCAAASSIPEGFTENLVVKSTAEDWYAIAMPAGGSTTFTAVFNHGNGDIDLELYDGCGGALLTNSTTNSSNEIMSYTNTSGSLQNLRLRVYLDSDTRQDYALLYSIDVPECPEDLTGDSTVNSDDLFDLLGAWGSCPGCTQDLTGDNTVNSDDLFQLLGAWGDC